VRVCLLGARADIADFMGTFGPDAANLFSPASPRVHRTLHSHEEMGGPAIARFINSGVVAMSNPKDPSTWPVHGGMRGANPHVSVMSLK
jgi:hypothetical protein